MGSLKIELVEKTIYDFGGFLKIPTIFG